MYRGANAQNSRLIFRLSRQKMLNLLQIRKKYTYVYNSQWFQMFYFRLYNLNNMKILRSYCVSNVLSNSPYI